MRLLAILAAAAAPAFSEWLAGAARADLTPPEPVWMAGYGSRTKPMEGVRRKIWAKALALRDSAGATSVLVTLDLCDIDRHSAARIAERARGLGIPRERLILNTSHTHSGPIFGPPDNYLFLMGPDPAIHSAAIARSTPFAATRSGDAIAEAVKALRPATVRFGQGFAGFAVNRRRVWKRELPGPVDHDVPVLEARGSDGRPIAVAVGYACHSTVLSDYRINGDWPGYFQESLESAYPGAVALFVQGAGADANPLPRRTEEIARRYGETLTAAAAEVLSGKMRPLSGPLRAVLEYVELGFQVPSRAQLEETARSKDSSAARHAKGLLAKLDRDGKLPPSHPYPVQAWNFGGMTMLALGGEVVADYALRFKGRYGWDSTWIAGYSNDVFAYIPSLRVLREGGYEGATAMQWDGHAGPFQEDVEEKIAAKVEEVVRKAR